MLEKISGPLKSFNGVCTLQGWQLVLTGHSLGAGVAALLALKLRPRWVARSAAKSC